MANDKLGAVEELVTRAGVTTCTIVDVLDGLGVVNAVLPSALRRLSGGGAMAFGTAYTVSWAPVRKGPQIKAASPSTWEQVRDFLVPEVSDGTGRIYVAGAGALLTEAALAGGMSVTYLLRQLGFNGVVLGGAVRDLAVIESMPLPVVAANVVPTDTQGAYRVHETGAECLIGEVRVRTGDWVFSDGNGVVVVPDDLVLDVLKLSAEIEATEQEILRRLGAGERLPGLIDALGRI
ncbi:RraA family protein [Sphaerisporangium album]|uniref:RraA family protein n=1 Tax=Sphaerisporangium album TaxID=509200 RepID=UPI0015F12550|nr:RraA family protein [Sphaerisporangium album]